MRASTNPLMVHSRHLLLGRITIRKSPVGKVAEVVCAKKRLNKTTADLITTHRQNTHIGFQFAVKKDESGLVCEEMGWFSVFLFMQGPRTITRDPSAAMPKQLPINDLNSLSRTHTKQTKSAPREATFSSQNDQGSHTESE
jgi:hypothetical protein